MNCDAVIVYAASVLVLLALFYPVWYVYQKKHPHKHLFCLSWILIVIWGMRFLTGLVNPLDGAENLTPFETLFDSLVHTLQTFSMDEDYTGYTAHGKEFLGTLGIPYLPDIYGIVNSVLSIVAPIWGGALLLEILSGFFPYLKLALQFRRDKFVFSSLNEEALALAEDVLRSKELLNLIHTPDAGVIKRKPLLIFSDAYLDQSSERSSELHAKAGDLGSVCLNQDMLHLSLRSSRSVTYFLVDRDPSQNISDLSQLLQSRDTDSPLWPERDDPDDPATRIYVFGQDGNGFALTKQICAKHPEAAQKALVRPIPGMTNTAFNLFYEAPLFLPLLSAPEEQRGELYVTILGGTPQAEELLKNAYWCGQMHSVRLHMTLVCGNAGRLLSGLSSQCPELVPSCTAGSPLLRIRPFGPEQYNPPYCETLQILPSGGDDLLSAVPQELLRKTHYFIVDQGSDEESLHLAERLRLFCVRSAMQDRRSNHVVIAPAVANDALADVVRNLAPGSFEPYMIPFGTLKSQYSCKQVFLTNFTLTAASAKALYSKRSQEADRDDIYNTLSSTARCVHSPYKLYDLGLIRSADLLPNAAPHYELKKGALTPEQEHIFAWTEHRRWNAFMRARGFVCPTREQLDSIYSERRAIKAISDKLHACLVESQVMPEELPAEAGYDRERYDYLDYVTMYACKLAADAEGRAPTAEEVKKKNYKAWDYTEYDKGFKKLMN